MTQEQLRKDDEDFKEFSELYKKHHIVKVYDYEDIDSAYFNIRKLLIQEKGEEDYKYLFNKKLRAIQEQIDDRITKDTLHYKLEYYNNDQANKLYRE
jgi:hypothetical protein